MLESVDREFYQRREENVVGDASIDGDAHIDHDSMEEKGHDYHSGDDDPTIYSPDDDCAIDNNIAEVQAPTLAAMLESVDNEFYQRREENVVGDASIDGDAHIDRDSMGEKGDDCEDNEEATTTSLFKLNYLMQRIKSNASSKRLLFLFMRQEEKMSSHTPAEIVATACKKSPSLLSLHRDMARVNCAKSFGFEVHTLSRQSSDHSDHVSFDVGLSVEHSASRKLPAAFTGYFQVCCDVIWMPASYEDQIYSSSFFNRFLPSLLPRLSPEGSIHLPATPHVFSGLIRSGLVKEGAGCLVRFLTPDLVAAENILAIVGEAYVTKGNLGKHPPSAYYLQPHYGLSFQQCRNICGASADILAFHPGNYRRDPDQEEPRVVALVIKRRLPEKRLPGLRPREWVRLTQDNFDEESQQETAENDDHDWIEGVDGRGLPSRRVSNLAREKAASRQVFMKLMSLDQVGPCPDNWTHTVIIFPREISSQLSSQSVYSKLRLHQPLTMKSFFREEMVAVQKGPCQLVMSFGLRVAPHGVLGTAGLRALAQKLKFEIKFLSNVVDHRYDPALPYQPVVVNTTEGAAGYDRSLPLVEIGFPTECFGLDLLSTFRRICEMGYEKGFLDLIVEYGTKDSRGPFVTCHMGPAVQDANGWIRNNDVSVAIPGLYASTARAPRAFREWKRLLNLVLTDGMIRRLLSGTDRESQGKLMVEEKQVASEFFYNYLMLDPTTLDKFIFSPGMTDGIGDSGVHLDTMNAVETLHDHNNWGIYYHEDLGHCLTDDSIKKLRSIQMNTTNKFSIHLCYSRFIIMSQARKLKNKDANVYTLAMMEAGDQDHELSLGWLGTARHERFLLYLRDPLNRYDFKTCCGIARASVVKEGSNRDLFLGTAAYCWFRLLDRYPTLKWRHYDEYCAVVAREVNGIVLLVQVTEFFLESDVGQRMFREELVENDQVGRLFRVFRVAMMRHDDKRRSLEKPRGSEQNRWVVSGSTVYRGDHDMEKVVAFVSFVTKQFKIIWHSTDLAQQVGVCETIVDKRLRKGLVADGIFDMSDVRGTFLVHLAAFIQAIPPTFASWASIKKPDGKISRTKGAGCYRFVNNIMRDAYPSRYPENLSTEQVRSVVDGTIGELIKSGRQVDYAFIDQNGCLNARRMFSTDGTDKRKNDLVFFHPDGTMFLPIQSHVLSCMKESGLSRRALRFFVKDRWFPLTDYRPPVPLTGLDDCATRSKSWRYGTMSEFRQGLLLGQDGELSSVV